MTRSTEGRSQNIAALRETLIQVREQVAQAYDDLDNARHTDIMLRMLRIHLEKQETDEAYQANLMLGYWLDVMPEAFDEVRKLLNKAHGTLELLTAEPGGTVEK